MSITHTYMGKDGYTITKKITPLQAIRAECMACSNFQYSVVAGCHIKLCPLWPFRSGKSGTKREYSEEQKKAMRDRMKKLHSKKA